MKVLVFGAVDEPFGALDEPGRAIMAALLAAGHDVTAFVPPGGRVDGLDRLDAVEGDVRQQSDVDTAVLGRDAVISAVAVAHRHPTTAYSDTAAAAVLAMERAGVRRILCLSSSRVDADEPGLTPLGRVYTKLILHRRYRNTFNDMERMESELVRTDLDWTVVRAVPLIDAPPTGRYRSALDQHVPGALPLPRAELARFVVEHLDAAVVYRRFVEVGA